jgi:hypothetical protein
MSCNYDDFEEVNVLFAQLYTQEGRTSALWAFHAMKSCCISGLDGADVAFECWLKFRKFLFTTGYTLSHPRPGETEEMRRARLTAIFYRKLNWAIKDELRRRKQKQVAAITNVDFDKYWDPVVAEAVSLAAPGYSDAYLDLLDELESLRRWVVTQSKASWEIVRAIITAAVDSERTGVYIRTIEALRSEVSRLVGREVSLHKVRHARDILREKAATMPGLLRFLRRKK